MSNVLELSLRAGMAAVFGCIALYEEQLKELWVKIE